MDERFIWNGYEAVWKCAGDGTRILWVWDPGDDTTPPSCEPMGEDTCACPKCSAKSKAALGWTPKAA